MAVFSKLWESRKGAVAVVSLGAGVLFYVNRRMHDQRKVKEVLDAQKAKTSKSRKDRAAVDLKFLRRLYQLLRIVVPGFFTREVGYLILVAVMLILRTYADVWMIQNGTAIEGSIIGRNYALFKKNLFKFLYAMPVISVVNNLLKYGLNELKLRFRERLSRHLYGRYMRGFTFYKMANLDNRISNADQLLTQVREDELLTVLAVSPTAC